VRDPRRFDPGARPPQRQPEARIEQKASSRYPKKPARTTYASALSSFDAFLEIVIGGTVLHSMEPVRLSAVISHKPAPPGEIWQSLGPAQLFDAAGNATGLILDAVRLNL
jgi:hypothetical protein